MSERTKDFDAFFAEMKREPVTFKLGGKTYELPPSLPAIIPVQMMELMEKHGSEEEIPEKALFNIGAEIFGAEVFKEISRQVDIEQLQEIIKWVFAVYGIQGADDEGNEKAPKKGQKKRASSKTGR